MTFEEAEIINYTMKSIVQADSLNDRIQKLFKEGKHEEVARIALDLNSELKRIYKDRLSSFPSLKDV